jgi:hypothetical protein
MKIVDIVAYPVTVPVSEAFQVSLGTGVWSSATPWQ